MKKTMTRKVYNFVDLSKGAKVKAREWYKENDDMPFLGEVVHESILSELKKRGYKVDDDLQVNFSLSYCQGDGVCFSGMVEIDAMWYEIRSDGSSHIIEAVDEREDESTPVLNEMCEVAKLAEKAGYAEIEYQNSDELVDETMEANEYTFTSTGERLNAD